jgi:hypothetical protein
MTKHADEIGSPDHLDTAWPGRERKRLATWFAHIEHQGLSTRMRLGVLPGAARLSFALATGPGDGSVVSEVSFMPCRSSIPSERRPPRSEEISVEGPRSIIPLIGLARLPVAGLRPAARGTPLNPVQLRRACRAQEQRLG